MSENNKPTINTAPVPPMPWEMMLKEGTSWFFEPTFNDDGELERMVLVFIPGQIMGADPSTGELMIGLIPPAVRIPFPSEAWEKFKEQVEKNGHVINIPVAKHMPGGGTLH